MKHSPFCHREGERDERIVERREEGGDVEEVLGEVGVRALGASVGCVLGAQEMSGAAATTCFG